MVAVLRTEGTGEEEVSRINQISQIHSSNTSQRTLLQPTLLSKRKSFETRIAYFLMF
jgi:hypothetical protein